MVLVASALGGVAVVAGGLYAAHKGLGISFGHGKHEVARAITSHTPSQPAPTGSGQSSTTAEALKHAGQVTQKLNAAKDFVDIHVQNGNTFDGNVGPQAISHFGYTPTPQSTERLRHISEYFYGRDMNKLNAGENLPISRLAVQMAMNGS